MIAVSLHLFAVNTGNRMCGCGGALDQASLNQSREFWYRYLVPKNALATKQRRNQDEATDERSNGRTVGMQAGIAVCTVIGISTSLSLS